jgi:hypothetical protein
MIQWFLGQRHDSRNPLLDAGISIEKTQTIAGPARSGFTEEWHLWHTRQLEKDSSITSRRAAGALYLNVEAKRAKKTLVLRVSLVCKQTP